jgi:hypothetical protein
MGEARRKGGLLLLVAAVEDQLRVSKEVIVEKKAPQESPLVVIETSEE